MSSHKARICFWIISVIACVSAFYGKNTEFFQGVIGNIAAAIWTAFVLHLFPSLNTFVKDLFIINMKGTSHSKMTCTGSLGHLGKDGKIT